MNYNNYIGLPYLSNGRTESGIDCWGLVRLFYKQELNIELPSYNDLYSDASSPEVSEVIKQYRDTWSSIATANPGDVCLFNIYGEPAHVGIYIGDNKFLHAREGRDSVVESLFSPQWSKRFQGFFKYTEQSSIAVTGIPHPLKSQALYDWTAAGTTVEDCANFINTKYSISQRLAKKLVLFVDGQIIPQDKWATTILQLGQVVTYKSVAEGRNATRLLLTIVVVYIALQTGYYAVGNESIFAAGATGEAAAANLAANGFTFSATVTATNIAGSALVNAIAPIRMPGQGADPGSAASLNLFTGASNQANRFGAIPVVLGKMRVTGLLGATPYVDTLSDTSIINLLLIWGFGPLSVTDIQIGTNPIENYYNKLEKEFAQDTPIPVTLKGYADESTADFDKLYGRDVEQQQVGILLTKNAEDGNPWQNVVFAQADSTSVDIAFTFPEGMRQLVVSGDGAGDIREANAAVEVQIRRYNTDTQTWPAWVARPTYVLGDYNATTATANAYTDVLSAVTYSNTATGEIVQLYQWYTYALSSTGEVVRFDGAATDAQYGEPSTELVNFYKTGSYSSLLGNDAETATYKRLPILPAGCIKLYTICNFEGAIVETIDHTTANFNYSGLDLTTEVIYNNYGSGQDGYVTPIGTKINISSGAIYGQILNQPTSGTKRTIFNSRQNIPGTITPSSYSGWSSFLKDNGVWKAGSGLPGGSLVEFNETVSVTFPVAGYYYIEASADDEGAVYIDSRLAVAVPKPGYNSTVGNLFYVEQGTFPVRVYGKNSGGGAASVACVITYTENGGLNNLATPDTLLTFGTPGFYYKRKDAFNFVYKIKNLPAGKYEIQVRRANDDAAEPADNLRNYNKVSLLSATAYTNGKPMRSIPNTYLARTALRIQSTSKANGSVDGVNAIVQTIALDWNAATQSWVERPTSNPASLFLYVLTHPGNAYRIKREDIYTQIDMPSIQAWHEYCSDNGFEFNSIITQTQSVMDVLKDICASAKASPTFVDGKWSVVIDKPRSYVTQHFTPHNSWGFESSKALPRVPDAFRVTFANRDRAYQADEIFVFNFGKTLATTEIFEELSLPGVTNAKQAKHLARWHLAQIKLRPEVYTINVDFEYLVCNRGDLVRVSHDVPLWGTGTGRVTGIIGSTIKLSEPVNLESGKTYQIRFRVNSISTQPGSDSVLRTLTAIPTTGWYDEIILTEAPGNLVETDNLYMLGEISKESQQLVVLSIEPADNVSARLTLADYSPQIYSFDVNSDVELPSYDANITGQSIPIVQNTITKAPIILSAISDSNLSEEISSGIYQNILIVSFGNVPNLTDQAKKIQLQVALGDAEFDSGSLIGVYEADKSAGNITVSGLKTLTIHKLRARYVNSTGTVSGPWSDIFYVSNGGKTDNISIVDAIDIVLDGTSLVATVANVTDKPNNFKTYEYRFYKDTGVEDFWELDPVTNGIIVVQSMASARLDLLEVPPPRMSATGVTYRVACRVLDNNNNYSSASAIGIYVLTTIQ